MKQAEHDPGRGGPDRDDAQGRDFRERQGDAATAIGRSRAEVGTPVLIVYSLIGRYTMTDLQEDRSLVRNLLSQGVDVWVVDWGNSSRADR